MIRWQQLALINVLALVFWVLTPVQTLCFVRRPSNTLEFVAQWVLYRPAEAVMAGTVLFCLGYDLCYGLLTLQNWWRRRSQTAP